MTRISATIRKIRAHMALAPLALAASLAFAAPVSAQDAVPDTAIFNTGINIGVVNQILAPAGVAAQFAPTDNGTTVIRFQFSGITYNVEPRECDANGANCQAALIYAFLDMPQGTDPAQLAAQVERFNRDNAFVKATYTAPLNVRLIRYHGVHYGTSYGAARREYANFANAFTSLFRDYLQPILPAGQ